MHKLMIVVAAAALAAPAAAQQTAPADPAANAADVNAVDNATGAAPMNDLAADPAMAPPAATTDPAMAPPAADTGYGPAPREQDDSFPWGLLGLAGLAGLLGRQRRTDSDSRRDRAA